MLADFPAMRVRTSFNAPAVEEVEPSTKLKTGLSAYSGAIGDAIIIMANDDFSVLSVDVALNDGDGNRLESGAAVENPAKSGRWVYTATSAVATGTTVRPSTRLRTGIAVTASDRPGGVGSAEEEKAL